MQKFWLVVQRKGNRLPPAQLFLYEPLANIMKKIATALILITSITFINGQIKQTEFDNMLDNTVELINSLKKANYNRIENYLGLPKYEIEKRIGGIITNSSIDFNGLNGHNYLFPVFREMELENCLELTIIASEVLEKKNGESYSRAKYYFVVKAEIEFEQKTNKTLFKNVNLITEDADVQKWWLGQYSDYMVETKKVMDKFGYKMPPPAPPPSNLK